MDHNSFEYCLGFDSHQTFDELFPVTLCRTASERAELALRNGKVGCSFWYCSFDRDQTTSYTI